MISYFFLWGVLVLLTYSAKSKELNTLSVFFLFSLLVLFIGLRPITLGTDTVNYLEIYEGWDFGVLGSGLEYFFSFLVSALKYFNAPFSSLLVLIFLFFLLGIFVFWRSFFKGEYAFLLLVVSTTSFWLYSLNIMRNGVAFSFFLIGVCYYFKEGKNSIGFYVSFMAALGFHISILFPFLVLYFYPRNCISSNINKILIFVIFSFLLFLVGFNFIEFISSIVTFFQGVLPERLVSRFFLYFSMDQDHSLKIGYSYFLNLAVLLAGIFYEKKHKVKAGFESHELYKMSLFFVSIFVVLYPLIYSYSVFTRMVSTFEFFHIVLIFKLIHLNFKKNHATTLIVLMSSLFFIKVIVTGFLYNFLMHRF